MQRRHGLPVPDNMGISCIHKPLPRAGPCLSGIRLQYDTDRKEYPPAGKTRPEIRIESDLSPLFPYFEERRGIIDIMLPRANAIERFTAFALKTNGTLPLFGIPVENRLSPAFTTLQQQLPSFFKKHLL